MADVDSGYDDSNRAFVQAFLSYNSLTFDTAKPILAAIFSAHEGRDVHPDDVTNDDFTSYVSAANTALSPLDLEIRSSFHQQSRMRYYALVNTTSDTLTQLATTYSAEEIAFVKRLLDAIFDGPNNRGKREAMCISGMDAVQLGKTNGRNRRDTQDGAGQANLHGLTIKEAEDMLERLKEEGWLERSQKGFYSLSPRALMELKGWLVDTYNEPLDEQDDEARVDKIKFCHACKEIITVGQRCATQTCPCRLHDICIQNFFRVQRSQTCPICKVAWDGKDYVGEKAITTSESYLKGRRRSTNRPQPDVEMEDDEGEEEEEEEEDA